MTLAELCQKCFNLSYSNDETMTTNLVNAIMYPIKVEHGSCDYLTLQESFNHKVLYSKTSNDGKEGSRLSMLYMNDEPVLLFNQFGKWLDIYSSYHLDEDKLSRTRAKIMSCYDDPTLDILKSELLQDSHLNQEDSWMYTILRLNDFPHINDQ